MSTIIKRWDLTTFFHVDFFKDFSRNGSIFWEGHSTYFEVLPRWVYIGYKADDWFEWWWEWLALWF